MNSNQMPVSGGVAIFFAVVVGYLVIDPTALEGFRPAGDGRNIKQVQGLEDVQARLWQDPFAAAAKHQGSQDKKPTRIQLSGKANIPPVGKDEAPSFELTLKPADLNTPSSEATRHSLKRLTDEICKEAAEESGRDDDECKKEDKEEAMAEAPKGITVLAAMVSAGPYAKQAETRLRTRYAILSALGAEQYFPKDSEHIGFVDDLNESGAVNQKNLLILSKPGKKCKKEKPSEETCKRILNLKAGEEQLPLLMPYEWYENNEGAEKHVLLLWLDEDAFVHKPLTKLNLLFSSLGEHVSEIKLIGPYGSTVLKAMAGEAEKYKDTADKKFATLKKKVAVYSATATAVESALVKKKKVEVSSATTTAVESVLVSEDNNENHNKEPDVFNPVKEFNNRMERVFKYLNRTIADDGELTRIIVEELKKRVKPEKDETSGFHVAIVSEWDTTYGRALPDAFAVAACQQEAKCDKQKVDEYKQKLEEQKRKLEEYEKGSEEYEKGLEEYNKELRLYREELGRYEGDLEKYTKEHLHLFKYMRGIDGTMAGRDYSDQSKAKKVDASFDKESKVLIERPEGSSQKDYLRRLADQMDKELKADKKSIRAIGVLGSDVYDKLLVLKALKNKFPAAIFFTTDLDASLLHPENYNWTKNLIVASGFGLVAEAYSQNTENKKEKISAGIPPFRDGYQTSIFHSVRQSLRPDQLEYKIKDKLSIYEIGRGGAFNLTDFDNGKVDRGNNTSRFLLLLHIIFIMAFFVWHQRWYLTTKKYDNEKTNIIKSILQQLGPKVFAASVSVCIYLASYFLTTGGFEAVLVSLVFQIAFLLLLIWILFQRRRLMRGNVICQEKSSDKQNELLCKDGCTFSSACPAYKPFLIQPLGLLLIATIITVVLLLAHFISISQEPLSFTSGISIWPTEILRVIAGVLSLVLLIRGGFIMKKNSEEVVSYYKEHYGEFATKKVELPKGIKNKEDIIETWRVYVDNGELSQRIIRIVPLWATFIALCIIIVLTDPPHVPFRGIETFRFDKGILIFSIACYTFLIFAVIDATMLCRRFITRLIHIDTVWGFMDAAEHGSQARLKTIEQKCRREWCEIKLIARRTRDISQLVYYPIVVALLLIASRSTYFDNWNLPVGLAIVMSACVFLVICCTFLLRKSANHAKETSLNKIHEHKKELYYNDLDLSELPEELIKGASAKEIRELRKDVTDELIKRIEHYENEILSIHEGAFLPVTEQPWVKAATLLFGGGGTLILFEMMALG